MDFLPYEGIGFGVIPCISPMWWLTCISCLLLLQGLLALKPQYLPLFPMLCDCQFSKVSVESLFFLPKLPIPIPLGVTPIPIVLYPLRVLPLCPMKGFHDILNFDPRCNIVSHIIQQRDVLLHTHLPQSPNFRCTFVHPSTPLKHPLWNMFALVQFSTIRSSGLGYSHSSKSPQRLPIRSSATLWNSHFPFVSQTHIALIPLLLPLTCAIFFDN